MKSFIKRGLAISLGVASLILVSPSPLFAQLGGYGYGYGYLQSVMAVVRDVLYSDGQGGSRQAFLIEKYRDISLNEVEDYQLQIYSTKGLQIQRQVSLRDSTDYTVGMMMDMLGVQKDSTVLALTDDYNGNGVQDLRVSLFSYDSLGIFGEPRLLETDILIDGQTGEVLSQHYPTSGLPRAAAVELGVEGVHLVRRESGSVVVAFQEALKNNLDRVQRVRVSAIIRKPDGTYEAGPRKNMNLAPGQRVAIGSRFWMGAYYPDGKYEVILAVSSAQQAAYTRVFSVEK